MASPPPPPPPFATDFNVPYPPGARPPRPPFPVDFVSSQHPYVVEGNRQPLHVQKEEEALYLRVDLPGICKEALRVWADKDFLYFEGEDAKNDAEFDRESPRKFKGQVALSPQSAVYKIGEMKYVVKNGVLKVKIPTDD